MSHLRSFVRFWWSFIVGDDWQVAAGVALALTITWILAREGNEGWWFLPLAVTAVLAFSLWRASRASATEMGPADPRVEA